MSVVTVILNWNSWRETLACLRSLEELDRPACPLVVDNGSTNDSVARIREAFPDVEVIELEENLGFGGGCNAGIREALGRGAEFVWLLNNDTVVERRTLSALLENIRADAGIGAAGSAVWLMDRPGRVQVWGGWRVHMMLGVVSPIRAGAPVGRSGYITGASCLLRAEALRSTGLFDEGFFLYWEDADLGFRLRRNGWKLAVAGESRVWHKECASLGRRSVAHDYWNNASAVRFFRRYAKVPAIPLIAGGAYRMARRLALGDFQRIHAVLRGLAAGLRESAGDLEIIDGGRPAPRETASR
ncbi:MAG TPA: glycosyltransferase family 2 protein [Bryobacteraceae bacterium]|nr:glycosyltransferase family 2 protein [Bryobacteraceae bacterium]